MIEMHNNVNNLYGSEANMVSDEKFGKLRATAESFLTERFDTNESFEVANISDYKSKIHELMVHKIELELQNEELLRVQSELELSKDRYEDLYDFAPLSYLTLASNGFIKAINLTGSSLLGYDRSSLVGKPLSAFVSKGDFSTLCRHYTEVQGSDGRHSCEVELNRSLIPNLFVRLESIKSILDDGTVGIKMAISDITERRKIDNELIRAKDIAEMSRQAMANFIANMSHEIRTPMNAIMGFAEIVAHDDTAPEKTREQVGIILSASKSLLRIVNEILDLSKLQSGHYVIEGVDFDLHELAHDTIQFFENLTRQKGLILELNYELNVPFQVHGDHLRLRQVLMNLIGNAHKFTDSGFIRLSVKQGDLRDMIHFIITDTGIGISSNELDKIFNPFIQADNRVSRRYGGTGL